MKRDAIRLLLAVGVALGPAARGRAHEGPPFPILVDQPSGPYVVSVWADPDVGIGTFFVIIDAPKDAPAPDVRAVSVCVRPLTGRLAEACHAAERQNLRDRVQFRAEVPFDAEERWHVRVTLEGPQGVAEVATEVDVTPPGLGPWDLAIYLFPFVLIAGLWTYGVLRHGRKRPARASSENVERGEGP